MKKIISLLLMLFLMFLFVACSCNEDTTDDSKENTWQDNLPEGADPDDALVFPPTDLPIG